MKPHVVVIVGLILLASIFLGFFVVGSHFLVKNQQYTEERFERQEQSEAEKRREKVAAAKDANADEAAIKKLRERLNKEVYEKRSSYSDLVKLAKKSKKELKYWYSADTDEDADQAEAYLEIYETRERSLQILISEAEQKAEECERKIAALRKRAEKLAEKAVALGEKSDVLARKLEQTNAERAKTEKTYAATPTFRRAPVEKKLREQEKRLKGFAASARRLCAEAEELERENSRTDLALRSEQERLDEILIRKTELLLEAALCREARRLTLAIVENIREIQKIKAEILEYEASREDKKIDAYL